MSWMSRANRHRSALRAATADTDDEGFAFWDGSSMMDAIVLPTRSGMSDERVEWEHRARLLAIRRYLDRTDLLQVILRASPVIPDDPARD